MSSIFCRRAGGLLSGASVLPRREIKSLKGKSNASARWVRRQWNDPIVKQAKREGLRSRAALKLRELNTKYQLIRKGDVVLDLGAAPGGWTQIAVEAACPGIKRAATEANNDTKQQSQQQPEKVNVIALDLKHFDPLIGAAIVVGDFRQAQVRSEIDKLLHGRKANVVLSDMAPSFSGNFLTDSQAQLRLCHNALKMTELYLKPGGNFATKILRCDGSEEFRDELKANFEFVKGMKPLSSRSESTEMFLVAKGYKGKKETLGGEEAK
ncbi:Ribosomal RNA large subunit methyltransferase j, partial [Globisporangium splendens]